MAGPDARGALAGVQLPDDLVAGLVREVDVELAVRGEVGRERDREQALLAAGGDEAAQVGVGLGRHLAVAHGADRACLLDDEQPLVAGRRGHVDRRAQPLGDRRRAGTTPPRPSRRAPAAPLPERSPRGRAARPGRRRFASSSSATYTRSADTANVGRRWRALYPVEDADLAAWCEAWNDGGAACLPRAPADLRHEAQTLGLVRALRLRTARAAERRGRAAAPLRVPAGHPAGARPARAPGAPRTRAWEARCSCSYWPGRARSAPR